MNVFNVILNVNNALELILTNVSNVTIKINYFKTTLAKYAQLTKSTSRNKKCA